MNFQKWSMILEKAEVRIRSEVEEVLQQMINPLNASAALI